MGETNTSFALILIQTADFWARTKSQQLSLLMKKLLIPCTINTPRNLIPSYYRALLTFYLFNVIMPLFLTMSTMLLITLSGIKVCRA